MNEIYPNFEGPKFRHQLHFEITSWFGRRFKRHKSKIVQTDSPLLLDIGVGENYQDGWTHIDFYSLKLKFWEKSVRRPEIETDLRYPLICPSNVVDGVYSGHTLELKIFRITWLKIYPV